LIMWDHWNSGITTSGINISVQWKYTLVNKLFLGSQSCLRAKSVIKMRVNPFQQIICLFWYLIVSEWLRVYPRPKMDDSRWN
jgi:hypothetical protein